MADDKWTFQPQKTGTVRITIEKADGDSLTTDFDPGGAGAFFAAFTNAFRAAQAMSGQPLPPAKYEGAIPPCEPDTVGLLHPRDSLTGMVLQFGQAYAVLDISNLDLEPLARALLMVSARQKPTGH